MIILLRPDSDGKHPLTAIEAYPPQTIIAPIVIDT